MCGLGVGFTTGAMPGFIIRAVPHSETGSATGFYQVVRSIGLTVGSALSAAVLMAHTRHGQALPDVDGFKAGPDHRCRPVPGHRGGQLRAARTRRHRPPTPLTAAEEKDLEVVMKEEAELGGAGMSRARSRMPAGPEEDRP